MEICGRANKIKERDRRAAVVQCVHTYRTRMKWFSEMNYLDAWYEHLDVEEALDRFETTGSKRSRVLREAAMKALLKDNAAAVAKLCRYENGKLRFKSNPLELVPINQLDDHADLEALQARIGDLIAIANYMGGTDEFNQAIASFAVSYAEQNDEDYAVFKKLIKSGELPCA